MRLRIVTPEKTIYDGEAKYIALTTDEGEQVILNGHAPYMSNITIGELKYTDESGQLHPYAVSSGFLQIVDNEARVLLDNALHTRDIDLAKAEEAKRRAEELLKEINTAEEVAKLKAQIKLANLHISTYKKYRSHTPPTAEIPDKGSL